MSSRTGQNRRNKRAYTSFNNIDKKAPRGLFCRCMCDPSNIRILSVKSPQNGHFDVSDNSRPDRGGCCLFELLLYIPSPDACLVFMSLQFFLKSRYPHGADSFRFAGSWTSKHRILSIAGESGREAKSLVLSKSQQ